MVDAVGLLLVNVALVSLAEDVTLLVVVKSKLNLCEAVVLCVVSIMGLVLVSKSATPVFSEAPGLSLLVVIVVCLLTVTEVSSSVTSVKPSEAMVVAFWVTKLPEVLTIAEVVLTGLDAAKMLPVTTALLAVAARVISSASADAVSALSVLPKVMF